MTLNDFERRFSQARFPWQASSRAFDFNQGFVDWIARHYLPTVLNKETAEIERWQAIQWINKAKYSEEREEDCMLQWFAYNAYLEKRTADAQAVSDSREEQNNADYDPNSPEALSARERMREMLKGMGMLGGKNLIAGLMVVLLAQPTLAQEADCKPCDGVTVQCELIQPPEPQGAIPPAPKKATGVLPALASIPVLGGLAAALFGGGDSSDSVDSSIPEPTNGTPESSPNSSADGAPTPVSDDPNFPSQNPELPPEMPAAPPDPVNPPADNPVPPTDSPSDPIDPVKPVPAPPMAIGLAVFAAISYISQRRKKNAQ
jgi:hypothetical protein